MEALTGRIAKKLRGELLKLGLNDPVVSRTTQAMEVIVHGELLPLFELPPDLDARIEVREDGELWKYKIEGAGAVVGFRTPHEAAVTAIRHLIHLEDRLEVDNEIDLQGQVVIRDSVSQADEKGHVSLLSELNDLIAEILANGREIVAVVPVVGWDSSNWSKTKEVVVYHRRAKKE